VAQELGSTIASYHLHKLLIDLRPEVEIVGPDDNPVERVSKQAAAIFAHEYIHYLHNFSTVAGYATFEIVQQLLALFSLTLDERGASGGSKALGSDQRGLYLDCLGRLCALYGDRPRETLTPESMVVASVREGKERVGEVEVETAWVTWEFGFGETSKREELRLGFLALTEGIAIECEHMLTTGSLDWAALPANVPLFPYAALRMLRAALAPSASRIDTVKLATLALGFNRVQFPIC